MGPVSTQKKCGQEVTYKGLVQGSEIDVQVVCQLKGKVIRLQCRH